MTTATTAPATTRDDLRARIAAAAPDAHGERTALIEGMGRAREAEAAEPTCIRCGGWLCWSERQGRGDTCNACLAKGYGAGHSDDPLTYDANDETTERTLTCGEVDVAVVLLSLPQRAPAPKALAARLAELGDVGDLTVTLDLTAEEDALLTFALGRAA